MKENAIADFQILSISKGISALFIAAIHTLVEKDYQVETAPNGNARLDMAFELIPDIIISILLRKAAGMLQNTEMTISGSNRQPVSTIRVILAGFSTKNSGKRT